MAKVSFRVENALVETIKVKPTWADLDNVRLLNGHPDASGWGARVPLKHCPMPKSGDELTLYRLVDGETEPVTVDEVLAFDSEFAYCTVWDHRRW